MGMRRSGRQTGNGPVQGGGRGMRNGRRNNQQ
jgi:hypothetical protein